MAHGASSLCQGTCGDMRSVRHCNFEDHRWDSSSPISRSFRGASGDFEGGRVSRALRKGHLGTSRVKVCQSMSKYVKVCQRLSKYVKVCQSMSKSLFLWSHKSGAALAQVVAWLHWPCPNPTGQTGHLATQLVTPSHVLG